MLQIHLFRTYDAYSALAAAPNVWSLHSASSYASGCERWRHLHFHHCLVHRPLGRPRELVDTLRNDAKTKSRAAPAVPFPFSTAPSALA